MTILTTYECNLCHARDISLEGFVCNTEIRIPKVTGKVYTDNTINLTIAHLCPECRIKFIQVLEDFLKTEIRSTNEIKKLNKSAVL
jgi:hypothetical protein